MKHSLYKRLTIWMLYAFYDAFVSFSSDSFEKCSSMTDSGLSLRKYSHDKICYMFYNNLTPFNQTYEVKDFSQSAQK